MNTKLIIFVYRFAAFRHIGVKIEWSGSGLDEVGVDAATGIVRIKINPKHFRPSEVDQLLGDATKARNKFGWQPQISFQVSSFIHKFIPISCITVPKCYN